MSVLSFKKHRFDLYSRATTRWMRIALGGRILAISLTTVLRGAAQNTDAPKANGGIVGGTVED
jgi:hypothetical protein